MSLRRILAEEGLIRKSGQEYRDSEYNLLTDAEVGFIRANDPVALAQLLDSTQGEMAYISTDTFGGVINQIFKEEALENPRAFKLKLEKEIYKVRDIRNKAEISASPYKKELAALKEVFDFTVTPADVKNIVYQPRKKKGIYTSAILDLAINYTGGVIGEEQCKRAGTTLQKLFEAMDAMGAKLVMKGMGPGKKKPWVDYDGWAY